MSLIKYLVFFILCVTPSFLATIFEINWSIWLVTFWGGMAYENYLNRSNIKIIRSTK